MTVDAEALSAELDRIRLELHTLKAEKGKQNITVGDYLLTRLAQLGVTVRRPLPSCFFILSFACAGYVWPSWRFQSGILGTLRSKCRWVNLI